MWKIILVAKPRRQILKFSLSTSTVSGINTALLTLNKRRRSKEKSIPRVHFINQRFNPVRDSCSRVSRVRSLSSQTNLHCRMASDEAFVAFFHPHYLETARSTQIITRRSWSVMLDDRVENRDRRPKSRTLQTSQNVLQHCNMTCDIETDAGECCVWLLVMTLLCALKKSTWLAD